jgi:hypothetical protein
MSLPYHVGNGVFGGLVPFIATLIASFAGSDPLSGLWYPIGIAAVGFVIGAIYLSNQKPDHGEEHHEDIPQDDKINYQEQIKAS